MDHNWWHHLSHGISKCQYSCIFSLLFGHNLGCGYTSLTHNISFFWNIWTSTFITIPDLPRGIYFQVFKEGFILVKKFIYDSWIGTHCPVHRQVVHLFDPDLWMVLQEKAHPFLSSFLGTLWEAFDVIDFSVLECQCMDFRPTQRETSPTKLQD